MDSKNKPAVLLEYYLKRLKLATMLKEYAAVAEVCGQERTDYLNFLLRLAEREVTEARRTSCRTTHHRGKLPRDQGYRHLRF